MAGGKPLAEVACQWIKDNRPIWQSWVPVETTCIAGFGVEDSQTRHLASRDGAVSCSVCPPGSFSESLVDGIGETYRCTSCPAGRSQRESGALLCQKCEPGTFSDRTGMAECIPCDLGTFANVSGSTACHICGDDDLWTTSRPLLREKVEKWVEVAGATSQAMCNCREGSHLHEGRCEMCSLGTRCPGSGNLELLPGYASLVNEPGQVFKCYGNFLRCPGGPPGTCAKGRDASSLACGSCRHRLHATGSGECASCASGLDRNPQIPAASATQTRVLVISHASLWRGDYALLLAGGLVLFGGTGAFHAVLNAGRDGKQDGRLLVASLSLSQLVTCAQVLSVIHQLDIEWGEPGPTLKGVRLLRFGL